MDVDGESLVDRFARTGRLTIAFEPGGGGTVFSTWLARRCGIDLSGAVATREGQAVTWSTETALVRDSASVALGRGTVELVAATADEGAVDPPLVATPELLRQCAEDELGMSTELATWLSDVFGQCTVVLDCPGCAGLSSVAECDREQFLDNGIREMPAFASLLRDLSARGGPQVLDLVRVVYLVAPHEMHLGDEWAQLASACSGRKYSLANINQLISEFPELFVRSVDRLGNAFVRPANRIVMLLFSGFVPGSSTEYYATFKWMRGRALESLVRRDSGDAYVAENLPRLALRAGALPELLADGAALLACDITSLTDCLESDPEVMSHPGAKAALLHAHRLGEHVPARAAQMELALRRMSLAREADRIDEFVSNRPWRPVWSSNNPVNVHRVIGEESAGALCISVVPDTAEFRGYVGFANGAVNQLRTHVPDVRVATPEQSPAEARGIDAVAIDGVDYVATASSDGVVRAYRVTDPEGTAHVTPIWSDHDSHSSPLSALTIQRDRAGAHFVIATGVEGLITRHELISGTPQPPIASWGAEVRGLRALEFGGASLLVFAAVDGRVGIYDLDDGREVCVASLAEFSEAKGTQLTPTCQSVLVVDDQLVFAVGCATGEVFCGVWRVGEQPYLYELEFPGVPPASVNAVDLCARNAGFDVTVGRSDGVWLRYDPMSPQPIRVFTGHVGPVLALAVMPLSSGEVAVVTGGAEGAVRLWRHSRTVQESLGFLRASRHRGPVRTVELREFDGALTLVTGGSDGDVRRWRRDDPHGSVVLARHDGEVSSMCWLKGPSDNTLLAVGARDGSVRLVDPRDGAAASLLLGIAHEGVRALLAGAQSGYLISGGNDGVVTRWDAMSGVARASVPICRYGAVLALASSRNSLLVGGQDGSLTLLDETAMEVRTSRMFESAVVALDAIEGTDFVLVGLASGEIDLIDLSRGLAASYRRLYHHGAGLISVRGIRLFGTLAVAIIGRDRILRVIDVNSRMALHEIALEGFPNSIAVLGNQVALATSVGATLLAFSTTGAGRG